MMLSLKNHTTLFLRRIPRRADGLEDGRFVPVKYSGILPPKIGIAGQATVLLVMQDHRIYAGFLDAEEE
jgi:hypothetical protein